MTYLGLVALLVRDYDDAIDFYVRALGFTLREDLPQGNGKRWMVVVPPDGTTGLLLARARRNIHEPRGNQPHLRGTGRDPATGTS